MFDHRFFVPFNFSLCTDILQAVNHGIVVDESNGRFILNEEVLYSKDYVKNTPCNCLPECTRSNYEADVVYSPLVEGIYPFFILILSGLMETVLCGIYCFTWNYN